MRRVKYWEIIADNLSKAGWSWDSVAALDSHGRTIWIADAHRSDGKRFIMHADEKLTAFVRANFFSQTKPHLYFSQSVTVLCAVRGLKRVYIALRRPLGASVNTSTSCMLQSVERCAIG